MLFKTGTLIAFILSTVKIQCYEKLSVFQFVLIISSSSSSFRSGEESVVTRAQYDSMAQLVGEPSYSDLWWSQRQTCFHTISPGLSDTLELAWQVVGVGGVREINDRSDDVRG